MNEQDRLAAEEIIRELDRRRAKNKIDSFYVTPENRLGYPVHMEFFEAGSKYRERLMCAANRVGKALKHGTKVATPKGWKEIELLSVGDEVIAGDGSITQVVGVYPQGEVDLFKISFDGIHFVETCGDHLWKYQEPKSRYPYRQSHGKKESNPFFGNWKIGNTRELMRYSFTPRRRPVVPNTKPFDLPESELPIDPYVLGALLGDGGLTGDSTKISSADSEIIESIRKHFKVVYYDNYDYGVNGVVTEIKKLGLFGKNSFDKFIPDQYLYADKDSRFALLQGLMDTDGSICKQNMAMEYSTSSDNLAIGFEWLANSLGLKTRKVRRQTTHQNGIGAPSWRISIRTGGVCPFRLSRKVNIWKPLKETSDWIIHNINSSGRGLATCIEVSHESHTFTIEHGIVTHNTEGVLCYEVALHLTGLYPSWWKGRRFTKPVRGWLGGDTATTTRDILQQKLLGDVGNFGTGLIRADLIADTTNKRGVPDAVEVIKVKHVSGGVSVVSMKSYDQGRTAWQGTEQDFVGLDEEPPEDIYSEAMIRTMTTGGIILTTYTPMYGMTELTQSFFEVDKADSKFVCTATWDDVAHLTKEMKQELWNSIPVHEREARAKGIPNIGFGKIYTANMENIVIDDFKLPKHWPRGYALDVGWNRTAALWGALDRDSDCLYIYSEHYQGQAEPAVHASAIKARGSLTGLIDPASRGRSQHDGQQIIELYRREGLNLIPADNAVEAGIFEVYQRLTSGRIRIFKTLTNIQKEMPLYHRDKNGHIVKKNDHLLDCLRYLCTGILHLAYSSERDGNYSSTNDGLRYLSSLPNKRYRGN